MAKHKMRMLWSGYRVVYTAAGWLRVWRDGDYEVIA